MMINDMKIKVSTEGIQKASNELVTCAKRLRFVTSELDVSIESLKSDVSDQSISAEIITLEKQKQEIEIKIEAINVMINVLDRLQNEIINTEDVIINHCNEMSLMSKNVEIQDLSEIAEMVNEVIRND